LYLADFGKCSDSSAASTISGPMPAQSPSVMPMRFKVARLSKLRAKDSQAGSLRH